MNELLVKAVGSDAAKAFFTKSALTAFTSSPEELAKTLRRARANGKAVVGMKIYGAGKLTRPEDKQAVYAWMKQSGLFG